jgi:hypothetical protein
MRTTIKLLLLAVPSLAMGQAPVMPNDVLVGGMESVLAIKQATANTYDISQLAPMPGAPPGNTAAICAGAALAYMKGYAGVSFGAVDDGVASSQKRTITLALLKSPAEVGALPTNLRWLPYRDIKSLRAPCERFVQAKYLWPAE